MIRKTLPNLFTLTNLFCGCLGIILTLNQEMVWASYLVGVALVCDFLDGFVARAIKGQSELGKQLDSLADMVTFGALPGIMLFQFITIAHFEYFDAFRERQFIPEACLGLMIPLFAALRLAKFNIDEGQKRHFLGLPTPAVAMMVAALPIILEVQFKLNFYYPPVGDVFANVAKFHRWDGFDRFVVNLLFDPTFLMLLAVGLSLVMVMPVKILALKFEGFGWAANKRIYIFLILVALCVTSVFVPYWVFVRFYFPEFQYTIIPIILILYILYNPIYNLISKEQ